MPIKNLDVPAATDNPLLIDRLPSSRPTIRFIANDVGKKQRIRILKEQSALSFLWAVISSLLFTQIPEESQFISPILIGFIMMYFWFLFRNQGLQNVVTEYPLLIALVVAFWFYRGDRHFVALAALSILLSFALAILFGEQCRQWTAKNVVWRTAADRNPSLGFLNALSLWFSYGALSHNVPGLVPHVTGHKIAQLIVHFSVTVNSILIGAFRETSTMDSTLKFWSGVLCWKPLLAGSMTMLSCFLGYICFAVERKQMRVAVSENWPQFMEGLRTSPDPIENRSVFLGFVEGDGSPVLYPIDNLVRHAWVVGSTGSGKTVLLNMLAEQIVNRNDTTFVYVDLKATSCEVLETIDVARRRVQQRDGSDKPTPLKYFTLEHGRSSYLFDIFSQKWWEKLPTHQRTGVLLSALSLAYSRAYGQSYFTDENYHLLHHVLKKHRNVNSFQELSGKLSDEVRFAKPWELSQSTKQAADHVNVIVQRLASIGPINAQTKHSATIRNKAIDFTEGFQSPHLYYFGLNAINNTILAGEVGRLVAASLSNAATTCDRQVPVVLVLDEWQEMVTSQLQILLRQARALNVGIILANQTTSDLIQPDVDLRPVVEGNTAMQVWLKVTDEIGREQLGRLGGQRIERLYSHTVNRNANGTTYGHSWQETIQDRLSPNLVSEIASNSNRFILRLTDNVGYACYGDLPFVASSVYTTTIDEYERRLKSVWPKLSKETLIVGEVESSNGPTEFKTVIPNKIPAASTHRLGG